MTHYPQIKAILEFSEELFDKTRDAGGLIKKHYLPERPFYEHFKIGDKARIRKFIEPKDGDEGYFDEEELFIEVAQFEWVHKEDYIFDFYFKVIDPPRNE